MKVFVSYSRKQGEWVWQRLLPVLKAAGVEPIIDRERFIAGIEVVAQMDANQDVADKHLLLLSRDYLESLMCQHEMRRALSVDPDFARGAILPVRLDHVALPTELERALHVDLRNDGSADQWQMVLAACNASLGVSAPAWLAARDAILRALERNRSVNLVTPPGMAWRELIEHLRMDCVPALGHVDLQRPATASRRGLVTALLDAIGARTPVPAEPEDLVTLDSALTRRGTSRLALTHFHFVQHRTHYGPDLFHALRYMVMDARKLVLLIQTEGKTFSELLPAEHPLSNMTMDTVNVMSAR